MQIKIQLRISFKRLFLAIMTSQNVLYCKFYMVYNFFMRMILFIGILEPRISFWNKVEKVVFV